MATTCEVKDLIAKQDRDLKALVDILNHRITKLEISVSWIKKFMGYIATVLTALFVAVLVKGVIS